MKADTRLPRPASEAWVSPHAYAGEFPARGTERIRLASAGFAESEAGGCSVGHSDGAIEADYLTTFALGLLTESARP